MARFQGFKHSNSQTLRKRKESSKILVNFSFREVHKENSRSSHRKFEKFASGGMNTAKALCMNCEIRKLAYHLCEVRYLRGLSAIRANLRPLMHLCELGGPDCSFANLEVNCEVRKCYGLICEFREGQFSKDRKLVGLVAKFANPKGLFANLRNLKGRFCQVEALRFPCEIHGFMRD
jgi:hypothetical protein